MFFSSCLTYRSPNRSSNMIGGVRDGHGCLSAAGEIWSRVRNSCLRIFDVGIRLNPVNTTKKGRAVFSAFVIFSEDKEFVELFLPTNHKSIILQYDKRANQYVFEMYCYDHVAGLLKYNGNSIYIREGSRD